MPSDRTKSTVKSLPRRCMCPVIIVTQAGPFGERDAAEVDADVGAAGAPLPAGLPDLTRRDVEEAVRQHLEDRGQVLLHLVLAAARA